MSNTKRVIKTSKHLVVILKLKFWVSMWSVFHACDTATIDLNASNMFYFAALGQYVSNLSEKMSRNVFVSWLKPKIKNM